MLQEERVHVDPGGGGDRLSPEHSFKNKAHTYLDPTDIVHH